jgi:hypothetical protein
MWVLFALPWALRHPGSWHLPSWFSRHLSLSLCGETCALGVLACALDGTRAVISILCPGSCVNVQPGCEHLGAKHPPGLAGIHWPAVWCRLHLGCLQGRDGHSSACTCCVGGINIGTVGAGRNCWLTAGSCRRPPPLLRKAPPMSPPWIPELSREARLFPCS